MFGLPILRKYSDRDPLDPTDDCEFPPCGPVLKLSNPLAEMRGNHFTIGLTVNKKDILSWGLNTNGDYTGVLGFPQAGSNYPQRSAIFRSIDSNTGLTENTNISRIRAYGHYSFILTERGFLYATGNNTNGIFNNGSSGANRVQYELVTDNVIDFDVVADGRYGESANLFVIKGDGKLYGCGGGHGSYGTGEENNRQYNTLQYLGINDCVRVFGTNPGTLGRTFVIKSDGSAWATGYNVSGSLGIGSSDHGIHYTWSRVKCKDTVNGLVYDMENVRNIIPSNWCEAAGANSGSAETWRGGDGTTLMCAYFLTTDGKVYVTGNNRFGQLGIGQDRSFQTDTPIKLAINNVSKIATTAGGASALAITATNEIYSWGNNQWGQLGHGNTTHAFVATKITGETATKMANENIIAINGGGHYGTVNGAFVILTAAGYVYAAGFNQTYALGITTNGTPDPGPIKTFRQNEYFGPPAPPGSPPGTLPRTLPGIVAQINMSAKGVDLCGYGTEMAQKVIIDDGTLLMSGWNQHVPPYWNFNPLAGTQNVDVPTMFILPANRDG